MRGKSAIITAFNPFKFRGGIETYTVMLADLLISHDVQSDIYHIGDDGTRGFHNDYLGKLYQTGKRFLELEKDYDMVIANGFYGLGYFPPGINTFNIFHSTHKGFADEIKDVVPLCQYLEWKFLWGELGESVSGFNRTKIAVSECVRDELKRYYSFDDVMVVTNGIDTERFIKADKVLSRKKWDIPQDAFVGLYVGRWDILKGCDLLEGVIMKMPDVYWVMVLGTGSEKDAVPQLVNVSVIEQVEHENMNEIFSAADFMLFPSRYEGFGYAIIEAMACELPVVTTNMGIAKTIYKDKPFNELLLPEFSTGLENVVRLALKKIEFLRSDNDMKEYLVKKGRELVEKEYDIGQWKKQIARILGVS